MLRDLVKASRVAHANGQSDKSRGVGDDRDRANCGDDKLTSIGSDLERSRYAWNSDEEPPG